ncbi:MAG: sugar nucleotide-binding protein [Thermoanaerobaculia bacterium]|nr:sugar nucleotide-binding protein [Thermoanaerobaculia bacterium]
MSRRAKAVAVLGASGMLGHAAAEYFRRRGDRVIAIARADFDIARDPVEKLEPLLEDADAILNCAGVIKPMIERSPIEDVLRVNTVFPRNLGRLGARRGVPTIHVTTDCVFSGRRGNYSEADVFDADDVYGMSKNGGDTADNMVLRTSIVGEEAGQHRSLLEWARSQAGQPVNGFVNHRWNGLTTVALAEVMGRILDEGLYERGNFHVHSPDTVTKAELLALISDVYDLKLRISSIAASEACDRSLTSLHPLSSRLSTKPIRQQLVEMRRFFRN